MLQVFQAQHLAEAHLVCNLLQAEGVDAGIRGKDLSSMLGVGSSAPGVLPTVWIFNSSESEKAHALVTRFTKGELGTSRGPSSSLHR